MKKELVLNENELCVTLDKKSIAQSITRELYYDSAYLFYCTIENRSEKEIVVILENAFLKANFKKSIYVDVSALKKLRPTFLKRFFYLFFRFDIVQIVIDLFGVYFENKKNQELEKVFNLYIDKKVNLGPGESVNGTVAFMPIQKKINSLHFKYKIDNIVNSVYLPVSL